MNNKKLSIIIIVALVLLAGAGGFIFGKLSASPKAPADEAGVSVTGSANENTSSNGSSNGSSNESTNGSGTEGITDSTDVSSADVPEIQTGTPAADPGETKAGEAGANETGNPGGTEGSDGSEIAGGEKTADSTGDHTAETGVNETGNPGGTAGTDGSEIASGEKAADGTGDPTVTPTGIPAADPTKTPTKAPAPTAIPAPTAVPTPVPIKAPVAAETGTPYENHGKLKVKGTKLVDKNNEAYMLRGISTHGIAWFPDYVNKESFRTLRDDWGANCIRLAMYTAEYNGYCSGGNKDDLKKLVANGVKYATELGMYVIIDWHILSDSDPRTNQAEALKFFEEMSKKYADLGNVIYEICNEPNGGTGWSQIKDYAEKVIPVIRKNAPDAIIVVGTPTWSQEVDKPAADPVKGYDNIMYTIHFYAATHKDDLRKRMQNAVNAGIALFCTEFGTCDASGSGGNDFTEAGKWIDAMENAGVSYCIWNLSNKSETSALIQSSCNKTSGWKESDLSASGKWYRKLLRSLTSGSLVSDGDSKTGEETGNHGDDSQGEKTGNSGDGTQGEDSGRNGNDSRKEGSDSNTGNRENDRDDSQNNDHNDNNGSPDTLAPAEARKGNMSARLTHTGGWNDGSSTFYQFTINIENTGNDQISDWKVTVDLGKEYALSQSWNGVYEEKGSKLVIGPVDYNSTIAAGQKTEAGFIISCTQTLSSISISVNAGSE